MPQSMWKGGTGGKEDGSDSLIAFRGDGERRREEVQ
jgi:hypothetical protein